MDIVMHTFNLSAWEVEAGKSLSSRPTRAIRETVSKKKSIHMCVYTYTYICVYIHVCVCAVLRQSVLIHLYTFIYTHIYLQVYMYTHTHTHTPLNLGNHFYYIKIHQQILSNYPEKFHCYPLYICIFSTFLNK